VYSTCSSEPEENEHVVAAFLQTAPEFSVLPLASAGIPPPIDAMATEEGYLRTTPACGLEAFFAAIFQRHSL
jgi:16S rRNA (cytosine967-C5)-methyltransferase